MGSMSAEKKKKISILEKILTIAVIMSVTSALYLYTSGYRLDKGKGNTIDLAKTGMVSAKSIPEGASVYLDGKLMTATNDTLSGIAPGKHKIKIEKKGFVPWNKEIEIYEELVTDITAVLVSQSPTLAPLTNTGAKYPSISPSQNKIAYFSEDGEKPGVWVTSLNGAGIGLFRNTSVMAVQDTKFVKYSQGKGIEWAPDETQLLIQAANDTYYLVDMASNTASTTSTPDKIRQDWQKLLLEKRTVLVEKLEVPENIKQLALSTRAIWAPDDKKFLYTVQAGDTLEYRTYNFERPIPIGEKIENTAFVTVLADAQPKVSWYSDSFHLILVEGNTEQDKRGIISLVRIDGTNKVEIYNNTLMFNSVFAVPSGDKIIILTSFKSGEQTDLYTVGIR
ncbi:MAG: PEGA domain protein [candidate division WWE3 bacterium GW2011_GWF2_42_42]|nr:MAG: PEGA domain protein [candidate division WWE3 bacterium GW2011_GWF2_42_42]